MMLRNNKLVWISAAALLIAMFTISAAGGWNGPLAQMDMPTDTPLPQATQDLSTPQVQDTPAPADNTLDTGVPSPVWTSIFTGFTPYPNATYGYYGSGMGSGCGGGMGMSSGYYGTGTPMSGMGSMGGMGSIGGMGSMGSMGGMSSGSCAMMGSSGMSMNSTSGDYSMSGMNMTNMNGYVASNASAWSNPWLLIGWVLLGVLVLSVLVGIGVGIAWLIRRPRQAPPA